MTAFIVGFILGMGAGFVIMTALAIASMDDVFIVQFSLWRSPQIRPTTYELCPNCAKIVEWTAHMPGNPPNEVKTI